MSSPSSIVNPPQASRDDERDVTGCHRHEISDQADGKHVRPRRKAAESLGDIGVARGQLRAAERVDVSDPAQHHLVVERSFQSARTKNPRANPIGDVGAEVEDGDWCTVISTHLTEIIKRHAADILSRQTVSEMLNKQKESTPAIVEEVNDRLSLGEIQAVLKNLLREKVSIRNLETILETLGNYANRIKDPEILTEYARASLGRTICMNLVNSELNLCCVTIDPEVEDLIQKAIRSTEGGSYLALEPGFIDNFVRAASKQLERLLAAGHHPVILTSAPVRFHVYNAIFTALPNVTVLSYNEVISTIKVESLGVINLSNDGGGVAGRRQLSHT